MLRISKCILYLTSSNIQITYQTSNRRHFAKRNKIKNLMTEFKSVFGALVETSTQKKRRLKLEKKGKIPQQKASEINTERSWVTENSSSNLKKILPIYSEGKDRDVAQCTSESTSYSRRTNRTISSPSEQNHTNSYINPDKGQTNPRKPSKNFKKTILRIKKPADQNIDNILRSEPNQVEQEMKLKTTNITYNLSAPTKDTNNNIDKSPSTGYSQVDLSIAENNNLNNNKLLVKDTSDIENAAAKRTSFEKLPDIIIKNLPSFSIMGSKQESSTEPIEVLSISGRDDISTVKFPSVTKILTQTMPLESKLALEAWKERMIKKLGQEGFDMHQKALLEDGASLHSCIAQSLLGKEYEIPSRIEPVFESVQCVLEDVHHVKAIETHVAHPKLHYKGVIDCVASYRGENYVIDWKKSERKKLDLKGTYDAPIQIAAYVGAINASNLYPFVIKHGLLVIAYTCGAPATVHEVRDDTLQHYWTAWLRRLQKYHVEAANGE